MKVESSLRFNNLSTSSMISIISLPLLALIITQLYNVYEVNNMKIILSPSKTANYQSNDNLISTDLLFPNQTKQLVSTIRKYNQKELSKALNIKGDILKETYKQYQNFHKNLSYQAFPSFEGLVFKQLTREQYTIKEFQYVSEHLYILDALYGVLRPGTLIKPYRLDMKAKLGIHLYQFWDIDAILEDDVIINLASDEFRLMVHRPVVSIVFLQKHGSDYRSQATYSKMARGQMLEYMIQHKVKNIEELIQFDTDGYTFDETRSSSDCLVFIK